jgi:CheY-like chemotaxis protein
LKIFILEDDEFRLKYIKEQLKAVFKDYEIISCNNVIEAKHILESSVFDYIFLDHDLGGKQFVDSNDANTGYQVAKFINEKKIKYDKCIIHSLNYPGAMKMSALLNNSIYLPIIMWSKENLEYIKNIILV